jgi:ABC-2 type transport system permease protein
MYPVNKLPAILKTISKINPLTYGVDALKHTILANEEIFDFSMVTNFTVLIAASILFVTIAGIVFERKK